MTELCVQRLPVQLEELGEEAAPLSCLGLPSRSPPFIVGLHLPGPWENLLGDLQGI